MSDPRHDFAPGGGTEGEANTQESLKALPSIPPAYGNPEAATLRRITTEDVVNHVTDALVLVIYSPKNGRFRRRVVFGITTAEKAVRRAEERGDEAWIVLSKIVPLGVIA